MPKSETFQQLPAPWDRIFSLTTRLFVWGLLLGVLYLLRPFFLLIFLTFVFAYIQSHGVEGLEHRFKKRAYRVSVVFGVFLGLIVATIYFLAPHVKEQTTDFLSNSERYMKEADDAIYGFIDRTPSLKNFLEGPSASSAHPDEVKKNDQEPGVKPPPEKEERQPIVSHVVAGLFRSADGKPGGNEKLSIEERIAPWIKGAAGILGATSSFLLAILFSFLIVLDLPKLSRMVRSLANTKLDFIYEEVAENIEMFARRLGRVLEAQVMIALVNTILTAIGISLLGIQNITFLSAIVFFCSFIPVAGVFISSAPICLLALRSGGESGIQLMLLAIGMILLVHTIEAYILNPKIYGHHLRMNAVLVLIVLTIGGKLFGVWGLVLGLPVVNYVFTVAIRRETPPDDGEAPKPGAARLEAKNRKAEPEPAS